MDIETMEPVVRLETPEREHWWDQVPGIDTAACECAPADLVEQHQEVPNEVDLHPSTLHPFVPMGAVAA